MYYGDEGEKLKKFNTHDAKGISLIREKNIKVFILTAESSESVHARFKKVKVDEYQHGISRFAAQGLFVPEISSEQYK